MNNNQAAERPIFCSIPAWAALSAGLLAAGTGLAQTPADGTVCTGDMRNGWSFAARTMDGHFDELVWTRAGEPDLLSGLSYYTTNAEGQPVWSGAFAEATRVVLIDLSGGAARDGSQISVYVEEWGWADGTCRGPAAQTGDSEAVLRSLIGLRDAQATNWLRRNEFSRTRTVTHSGTGKTERWSRADNSAVEVIFYMGFVSDVIPAEP